MARVQSSEQSEQSRTNIEGGHFVLVVSSVRGSSSINRYIYKNLGILLRLAMHLELFNKKIKKIILSPHYDDFVLSLGGLAVELAKKKCRIEDWVIFSNSNHIARDYEGNKDISKERIKTVSNIRFKEELLAAKEIGNVKIN